MGHCATCGAQVTSGAHFCTSCGAPVEVAGGGAATQTRRPSAETLRMEEQRLLSAVRQATLGEYEVLGEIGKGGMAVVYLAHDLALDRKVAIKVMSPLLQLTDPGVQERFKREARTAAQLSHPNIIPVYTVKQSGSLVYFVMKYIQGRSLEAVIRDTGAMPVPVARTVLSQVGSALGHAHKNGVVHRDMKPGNVMLDESGWVAVTDFGIAKVANAQALTQTGGVVGTPAYMSPEQCAGGEVTGASDQYSLGIMAYEMLTGRQPFSGLTLVNLIYDHCHTPPPPVLERRPDCPPEIAAAVMRMLEKKVADRFPTVEDAVEALGVSSEGEGGEAKRQILTMVQAGSVGRSLLEQFPTPRSPVPLSAGHQRPAVAPPVPATRVTPPPPAEPGRVPRRALWWAVPAVALIAGGGIWMALRPGAGAPGGKAPDAPSAPAPAGPAVARLEVAPLSVSLAPGAQAALRATGRDSAGNDVPIASLTWESSNPEVATVSPGGAVRAVAPGVAQLTVRSGTGSAAAVVTVTKPAQAPPLAQRPPEVTSTPPQPAETTAHAPAGSVAVSSPPPTAADVVRDTPRVAVQEAPKATVQQAPPSPVREEPPPPVDPRPEIERILDTYRRAIESRDLARLRAAYPGLTPDQERPWREFFSSVTELSARLAIRDLQVNGDRAQASVAGTYEFRSGSRQTQTVQFVAGFERGPAGWRLVTIK